MPRTKRNSKKTQNNFLYFRKGYDFYQHGDFQKAQKQLRILIQISPKFLETYYVLFKLYIKTHRPDKAKQILIKAIEQHPNNPRLNFKLAKFLARQNKFSDSIKYVLAALRRQPKNFRYHNFLGLILQRLGKIQQATKQYQKVIKIQQKNHCAHSILGGIYLIQGKYQQAKIQLQKAVILKPRHAFSQHALGTIYYEQGSYLKALQRFKNAVQLKPNVLIYRRDLGLTFKVLGQFKQASQQFNKMLSLDCENSEAQNMIGCLLCYEKKYNEALQHLQKSIQNDPDNYQAHNNLALVYKFLQKYQQQRNEIKTSLSINQNSIKTLLNYGIMNIEDGQMEKAKQCLIRIKQIFNKNSSEIKKHQLLAQQNLNFNDERHIKQGIQLFENAHEDLKQIKKNYKHFYCPSKSLLQLLQVIYQPVVKYLQKTLDQINQPSRSQDQFKNQLQECKQQISIKMKKLIQYLEFKNPDNRQSLLKEELTKDIHYIHLQKNSHKKSSSIFKLCSEQMPLKCSLI